MYVNRVTFKISKPVYTVEFGRIVSKNETVIMGGATMYEFSNSPTVESSE